MQENNVCLKIKNTKWKILDSEITLQNDQSKHLDKEPEMYKSPSVYLLGYQR